MNSQKEAKSAFDSETFEKDGHFKIDRPVGSASISPCGRDIVLASRDGLDIIDLDNPYTAPRHLSHQTPWEVADVQWSPFSSRDYWIVSTSNQKALVWNVGRPDSDASIEHVLHGHKRAITDINFSAHYPDILATCAIDSFIHCWDLRRPSKPALTFCDWFAGATQVKWNRQEAHVLASSHDKYLKIWDDRNGAQPLKTIAAHATKIYGVDWDRKDTRMLTTCSLDQTIKSWNYTEDTDTPTRVFQTSFPVWRARYTPFGHGIVALPQRDDFDLHLYDRSMDPELAATPVHRFKGHSNQVKEFLWRVRGDVTDSDDTREFQLVSWGADQQLRLHRVHKDTLRKVDHTQSEGGERRINFTRKGAKYKSFQKVQKPVHDPIYEWETSRAPTGLTSGISHQFAPYSTGYGSQGFMSAADRKNTSTKAADPIAWMRGVKIRKQSSPPSGMAGLVDDLYPADNKATSWDNFDSLGEEVTVVVDKFPKVGIQTIDIKHRTLTFLLPGLSFKARPHTNLKCRLDFPRSYPTGASPSLTIDNSESEDFVLTASALEEVKQLTAAYLVKERHSLEAILRFLLGEVTLEESIQMLEKPQDLAASTLLVDDSTSSEDDEPDDTTNSIPLDDISTTSKPAPVNNARYNVPSPITCGAKFTIGGALVHFTLPKRADSSLLGQSLGIGSQGSSTSRDMFEGFGRLHQSHRTKKLSPTIGTTMSDDSENESFELSSSESSTSSTNPYQLKSAFLPTAPWNGFDPGLPFGHDMTASQQSQADVALTHQTSLSATKTATKITIHPPIQSQLLNERLTQNYRCGSDHETAKHNARTAANMGFKELEDIWSLCSITSKMTPAVSGNAHDVMSASRTVSHAMLENDIKAIENPGHTAPSNNQDAMTTDIDEWIADQCLQNLERIGDAQTLAMLTCALSPGANSTAQEIPTDRGMSQVEPELLRHNLESERASLTQRSPINDSWKDDLNLLFNDRSNPPGIPEAPSIAQRHLLEGSSPPDLRHVRANSVSKLAHLHALSGSQEERGFRRTSSTLQTSAISFTKDIQYSHSAASSPPNSRSKKKLSPAGSLLSAGHVTGAWMPSQWLSKASFGSDDSRSTISPPKARITARKGVEDPGRAYTRLKLNLMNEQHFWSSDGPILNPRDTHKHNQWRYNYAEILSAWGMHLESAEIRKYNGAIHASGPPSLLAPEATTATRQEQYLGLRMSCTKCSYISATTQASTCEHCKARQPPAFCHYCRRYITGLSSPCLRCGHALHLQCRCDLAEQDITNCVTGCGCACAEQGVVAVPMPKPRSTKADQNLSLPPERPRVTRSVSSTQDDGAYHSLAKALDKRRESRGGGLKATQSHVWRDG